MGDYLEFLKNKVKLSPAAGFPCSPDEVNALLKPHQRDGVIWAVTGGRRALFEAFGLGKTVQELEVCRIITGPTRAGGRALIVLPLGVVQEFKRDAEMLGIEVKFIRRIEDADETGIYLTNYETVRDGKLDPNEFKCVCLDEASVLRSFGSKTYQTFLTLFDQVPYRFVATATPSPNRYKELIHYAGFLGIMDTGQALTRFFQRDSTKANNLTLYPHKEQEFWLWVASWALFLQKPSDLGYSDDGYDLPELKIHYHEVATDWKPEPDRDGQVRFFSNAAMSLQGAAKEKRDSLEARIAKAAEIVAAEPDEHWLIWHDLEAERHAIKKAIPQSMDVYGSQEIGERERRVIAFSNGEITHLSTKPVIAGSGCNFQRHCARAVYPGIGFKFNDFIQSIHRIYRFLQVRECHIHIVFTDTEREILKELQRKWKEHEIMVQKMTEIIKKYGLSHVDMLSTLTRAIGVDRIEAKGERYLVANNDCVDECKRIEDNSIGLIHTSIPFSNHYEYTPSYNDFGHTENNKHFWQQMDYLTPELYRILKPGRIAAIHVKDRVLFGNVEGTGLPTISKFHNEAVAHYAGMASFDIKGHGFDYLGMITVVTDVVRENNQTYRLGWSEQCKDGTKMGVGCPEYVLLFHKPQSDRTKGYADERVTKDKLEYTRARWQVDAHQYWRSSGNRFMTVDELAKLSPDKLAKAFTEFSLSQIYDYESHIRIGEELDARGALPSTFMCLAPGSHDPDVWHDVNRMRTLNGNQTQRGLQNHVCPLQFDIVDRIITRYSNKDDIVFDPFGGLMTVPYRAIHLGRRGRASELNLGYFTDGVKYLEAAEREVTMPSLFDFISDDITAA